MIKTKCVYDKKEPDDGKWILVDREWPQNVPKGKVDKWYPELGPSLELLSAYKKRKILKEEYIKRFIEEVNKQKELIKEISERKEKFSFVTADLKYWPRDLLNSLLYLYRYKIKSDKAQVLLTLHAMYDIYQKENTKRRNLKSLLDKSVRLAPNDAGVWCYRGCALMFKKDHYKEARKSFLSALKLSPNDTEIWYSLGCFLSGLKEYEEAKESFAKCIKLTPKEDRGWHARGIMHFFMLDIESAKDDLKKAMELGSSGVSAAMYYFVSGVHKLLNARLGRSTQEIIKIFKEAKNDFESGARTGWLFSKDLKILAEIVVTDCKFEQYLLRSLSSFKKGVDELSENLTKLERWRCHPVIVDGVVHPVVINVIKGKLFYLSILKKAMCFKKIDHNLIYKAKQILVLQNFQGFEEMSLSGLDNFIALLEEYRKKGCTNIKDLPPKIKQILMEQIEFSAHYASDRLTRQEIAHMIRRYHDSLLHYMQEGQQMQERFQKHTMRDHIVMQENLKRLQPPLPRKVPKRKEEKLKYAVWTDSGRDILTQEEIDWYKENAVLMEDDTNKVYIRDKNKIVKEFRHKSKLCEFFKLFLKHGGNVRKHENIFKELWPKGKWPKNKKGEVKVKNRINKLKDRLEDILTKYNLGKIEYTEVSLYFEKDFEFCLANKKTEPYY